MRWPSGASHFRGQPPRKSDATRFDLGTTQSPTSRPLLLPVTPSSSHVSVSSLVVLLARPVDSPPLPLPARVLRLSNFDRASRRRSELERARGAHRGWRRVQQGSKSGGRSGSRLNGASWRAGAARARPRPTHLEPPAKSSRRPTPRRAGGHGADLCSFPFVQHEALPRQPSYWAAEDHRDRR